MSKIGSIHLAFLLVFTPGINVFGQWSPVNSGTTSNLNGAVLLDSGTAFVVGDTGTILKSSDAGTTWTPLTSGQARRCMAFIFLIPTKEWLLATAAQFFARPMEVLPGKPLPAASKIVLDQFRLMEQTEFAEATPRIFFTPLTQGHRGRSVRVGFLAGDSSALRC